MVMGTMNTYLARRIVGASLADDGERFRGVLEFARYERLFFTIARCWPNRPRPRARRR
jgi:hypothetical protein